MYIFKTSSGIYRKKVVLSLQVFPCLICFMQNKLRFVLSEEKLPIHMILYAEHINLLSVKVSDLLCFESHSLEWVVKYLHSSLKHTLISSEKINIVLVTKQKVLCSLIFFLAYFLLTQRRNYESEYDRYCDRYFQRGQRIRLLRRSRNFCS